jgi:tetratricopeptide (TPR) repeat protein
MLLSESSRKVDTNYLKTCAEHLSAIGTALQAYEKEHADFPEWLSELHPKYLSDADALICPADEDQGIPILPYNSDPNLPGSYYYEFDPGYREWINGERSVYDDANPIVRCKHHANHDADSTLISNLYLNLSYSNNIYLSDAFWDKHPVKMYGSLEAAITAYERALQLVPENPDFFKLYSELIRLYVEAERDKDAKNLIDSFKSVMKPDEDIMRFRDYWTLVDMLKMIGRHEEALQLLQHLENTEQENYFITSIFREIAMIHEEKGNAKLAKAYFLKADLNLQKRIFSKLIQGWR